LLLLPLSFPVKRYKTVVVIAVVFSSKKIQRRKAHSMSKTYGMTVLVIEGEAVGIPGMHNKQGHSACCGGCCNV
jgi:hypothetical protein